MTTLTANVLLRPEHCCHKLPTSCRLTARPICCACQDTRPHASSYRKYIDGVGFVMLGTRQDNYCWPCKVFWDERVACSGLRQEDTQIPNIPGIALFLNTWHDWHRGFRMIRLEDGSEERQELRGQPLHTVEIGNLPRPARRISMYDRRSIPWVIADEPDSELLPAPSETAEVYIPEEDRLFDSDSEGPGEAAAAARQESSATNQESMAETNPAGFGGDQLQELGDILQRLRGLTTGLERASSRLEPFLQQHSESSGLAELQNGLNNVDSLLRTQATWVTNTLLQFDLGTSHNEIQHATTTTTQRNDAVVREAQRQRYVRLFGTAEDVQQPGYVSPLAQMFTRHQERFRAAEEERRRRTSLSNNSSALPQTQFMGVPTSVLRDVYNRESQTTERMFDTLQAVINSRSTSRQNQGQGNSSVRPFESLLPPPEVALTDEQMHIKLQCTVCLEQVADVALVPCGHVIMCRWCSERHSRIDTYLSEERHLAKICPLCRGTIKQRVRIYGWHSNGQAPAPILKLPKTADGVSGSSEDS